jgi:phosphatidate cytidylyltransferase
VTPKGKRPLADLGIRVVSGAFMAAGALVTAWLGGVVMIAVWLALAGFVLAEWWRITRGWPLWQGAGIIYAAIVVIVPLTLRWSGDYGLPALLWLFAVVWTSDVMAYVCGRLIGGPKLWPRVSPGKTWAGFIGGTAFAAVAASAVAVWAGVPSLLPVVLVSLVAAMISQGGDLFESAIKRNFGVKDAGAVIPGHGGVMDRLDGFIAAGLFALVLGVVRGGWGAAGQGVLIW